MTPRAARTPMKAVVCTRYGPPEVLQLRNVERPAPGERDLLVRVRASAVSSSDCYIRSGAPWASWPYRLMVRLVLGIRRPRRSILGAVPAGEVVEVGKRVRRFRVGDRVFAFTLMRFGGYAEYARVPETSIVATVPPSLGDEEAAAIPFGGLLALHFLRKAQPRPGQQVLVYGASGAIGTAAVQLARHFGARVIAACGPAHVELVRSLGADTVLDYTRERQLGATRCDLVFDAVGRRRTSPLKDACRAALGAGGAYVSVDDGMPRLRAEDLELLARLAEAGHLRPVIDRRYALEEAAAAHRYVEQGHKAGNVVLTVAG